MELERIENLFQNQNLTFIKKKNDYINEKLLWLGVTEKTKF